MHREQKFRQIHIRERIHIEVISIAIRTSKIANITISDMDLDGTLEPHLLVVLLPLRSAAALYDFLHSRDTITATMPLRGMTALKLRHRAADPDSCEIQVCHVQRVEPGEYLSVTGLPLPLQACAVTTLFAYPDEIRSRHGEIYSASDLPRSRQCEKSRLQRKAKVCLHFRPRAEERDLQPPVANRRFPLCTLRAYLTPGVDSKG